MELATVVAIAGVLSALLVPALSTAKEKSRRTVCKSNLRQLFVCSFEYATDNGGVLPSSEDNYGNYHSIRLSDDSFTNLVTEYAAGNSNIFYCPNVVFASSGAVQQHDQYGYVIGYSYLAGATLTTPKGAETYRLPSSMDNVSPTNELFADANYWSTSGGAFPPGLKIAPHGSMGAAVAGNTAFTVGLPGNSSAGIGALGGNVVYFDCSVVWRSIWQMQTNPASSVGDAQASW